MRAPAADLLGVGALALRYNPVWDSAVASAVGEPYGDDVNSFKVPCCTLFDAALRHDIGAAQRAHGLDMGRVRLMLSVID